VRFKVDQNLPVEVAGALRVAGHDAATVYEESLAGAPGPQVVNVARAEGRAILTPDVGFADLRSYPPSTLASWSCAQRARIRRRCPAWLPA
jgi:predicted nuclease of predicted toxin-antitoxin system